MLVNDAQLLARGFSGRYHRLFIQRWLEQLHRSTLDTYSYKLLNSHTAVRELYEVVTLHLGPYGMASAHLVDVWGEAREGVLRDPAIPRKDPGLRLALMRLLTKCPAHDDLQRLRQVRNELKPLVNALDQSYLDWLLECVTEDMATDSHLQAVPIVDSLCSELIGRRNPDSLYLLGRGLADGQGAFRDRWAHVVHVLRRPPQTMLVFLPISRSVGSALALEAQRLQLSIVDAATASTRPTYGGARVPPFDLSALVTVEDAEDPKTAAFRALETLTQSLCLVANQSQMRAFQYPPSAHVEYDGSAGRKVIKVQLDYTARWWDENPQLCGVLLGVLESPTLEGEDRQRLRSSLEYLRLGGLSSSPATALAENWVALETLVRQGGASMADIRRYVPALLCSGYVQRLLANFLEGVDRGLIDISAVVPAGTRDARVKTLLKALRDPVKVSAIEQACIESELLRFRLSELVLTFRDGPAVAGLLNRHRLRLERHLQRIYRLRNAIVHAGETHSYVVPCLRHLSGYVQGALIEVGERIAAGARSVTEVLTSLYHGHYTTIDELSSQTGLDEELAIRGWLPQ